mmetsp:Transcript_6936/g.19449  ORF Transcript_6936/g.19449 Transcript_6936/m.19449 type:complete len:684 (-) Transcript_6936:3357-5408(-)
MRNNQRSSPYSSPSSRQRRRAGSPTSSSSSFSPSERSTYLLIGLLLLALLVSSQFSTLAHLSRGSSYWDGPSNSTHDDSNNNDIPLLWFPENAQQSQSSQSPRSSSLSHQNYHFDWKSVFLYTPIVKDTGRSGLGNGPEEVCDFSKKYRFLSKWCKDKHDWAEIQANDRPFGFLDHNVPHLIQKEQEMDVDPTDDEDANHEEDGSNKNATTTIDIRVQLLQQYSGTYSVETVPGGNTQQRQLHVQGDDFLFLWKGNNTRLCHLFRAMHQVMNDDVYLEQVVRDGNAGNGTTAAAARALLKDANKEVGNGISNNNNNYQLTVHFHRRTCGPTGGFGQGNWVQAFYIMRMAAARNQVAIELKCPSKNDRLEYPLVWYAGTYPAPANVDRYFAPLVPPTEDETCHFDYSGNRIDKMAPHIQRDLRTMAMALVGRHNPTRPLYSAAALASVVAQEEKDANNAQPILPNIILDDVVIHFRCGDIMSGMGRNDFGLIKFASYKRYISPQAKSVGILTQTFNVSSRLAFNGIRSRDMEQAGKCQQATHLLVDYLRDYMGNDVRITIHNDAVKETLPLAFARLVMANQSFVSLSTLGILPTIASFGHGYSQLGTEGCNWWNKYFTPATLENHTIMQNELLPMGSIGIMLKQFGVQGVLDWLSKDDYHVECEGPCSRGRCNGKCHQVNQTIV